MVILQSMNKRAIKMQELFKKQDTEEDNGTVDFGSAALYLAGAQTLIAVCACAITSVLSCWLLPPSTVSAVRTLTLASIVGGLLVMHPVRVGRVHGLSVVFSSLRPAVPLYLAALVCEQLVHTCSTDATTSPSWRRVVFLCAVLVMLVSGFMRARQPSAKTDVPFLIVLVSLLVVALLPPPAVALAGPLCEPPTLFAAAERIIRSLSFAAVFVTFVFCSTPTTVSSSESTVVVIRSFAASVWTLGSPIILLILTIPQCCMTAISRLRTEHQAMANYSTVDTVSPPPEIEYGGFPGRLPVSPKQLSPSNTEKSAHAVFGQLSLRSIGNGELEFSKVKEKRELTKADMARLAESIQ